MNTWRPEGWNKGGNPKIKGVQYHNYDTDSFEAGASSMLEALRNNKLSPLKLAFITLVSKGKVVVIPDDKE